MSTAAKPLPLTISRRYGTRTRGVQFVLVEPRGIQAFAMAGRYSRAVLMCNRVHLVPCKTIAVMHKTGLRCTHDYAKPANHDHP